MALLVALVVALLAAVPGLRSVLDDIGEMSPWWIAGGVALELASCVSFVVIFRHFFDRVPVLAAHQLAWTEMGSGALLPGGGIGGLALGGWLLHLAGMPSRRIVERSSALFFLTSGINVLALGGAGALLLVGIAPGPHDLLRAGLPVLVAAAVAGVVVALPRLRRLAWHARGATLLGDLSSGIVEAERTLLRPRWRLLGAVGYLGFDIAVLWATLSALGWSPPLAPLVLGYLVGYLANLIPVPGNVGSLDAGLAGALVLYGAPATKATAAVLVYHAIAFWVPGLGGLLGYALLQRRPARARRPAEAGGPPPHVGYATKQ
ncbi:MAG: flippase-like protein [Conexibacter sp.]|nr:flippase-like protein [Conexibacter sp.]